MNKSWLSVAVIAGGLLSCAEQSNEQQTKRTDEVQVVQKLDLTATEIKNIEKIKDIKKNGEESNEKEALKPQTRSAHINGEKFKLFASKNVQGSKVFNVSMQEYGTLKGGIVVVSKDNILKSESFKHFNLVKIANNTFRLTPVQELDLVAEYKRLSTMPSFEVVELEVDYSPINNRPTY